MLLFCPLPEDEGSLLVHEVELVVQPGPGLAHRRRVRQGAHGTLYLEKECTYIVL